MDHDIGSLMGSLLEREGGYVNHPADRGGAICFGITQEVARSNGSWSDARPPA